MNIVYVAVLMIPSMVIESAPAGNSNQMASIVNDILDLKLQLKTERERRMKLETEFDMYKQIQGAIGHEVRNFDGQMNKLINGQNVAFYARLSKSYDNISPWATVVFDDVETNNGSSYNSTSGEFTAPVPGTYVFFSNILSGIDQRIETSLRINGVDKMFLHSGGKFHGSGSNMAVVNLNAGDKVKMVKHGSWGTGPSYIHQTWSSFSGFLLRADPSFFLSSYSTPVEANLATVRGGL
jgi:hypothetical protein